MSLGLNRAFEQSVLSNAEDALRNQVLLLIANIDVIDGEVVVPPFLPEARLTQADSSLFAQIQTPKGNVIWRSRSLLGASLPVAKSSQGQFRFFEKLKWPSRPNIYTTTLGIEWETDDGDFPFVVQVAEHSQAYEKRLARYQRQVGFWLLVLGSALIVLLLIILGWALKPLNKVATQVGEIEEGIRQRFDEDYPLEVSRLTQNLNQLLNFEEQRIGRQKEVLGNLAHSLKTPIAVLSGLAFSKENDSEARAQLSTMQTIIDYQLQSASAVGRRRFAKPVSIYESTQQIVNSLKKLHQDKELQANLNMDEGLHFYGDQGDWMELAGNLLDNAFKWAAKSVSVSVTSLSLNDSQSHRNGVRLIVEDDGPGIDDQLKQTILQRGVRLDSQTPGHGLGLHIVKGIVEAYNGELIVENAVGGGTRFSVDLN